MLCHGTGLWNKSSTLKCLFKDVLPSLKFATTRACRILHQGLGQFDLSRCHNASTLLAIFPCQEEACTSCELAADASAVAFRAFASECIRSFDGSQGKTGLGALRAEDVKSSRPAPETSDNLHALPAHVLFIIP